MKEAANPFSRDGLPGPTSVVPKPALAVRWGLGTPRRRSIWPKAVWESPTTPCRRRPVLPGSFHKPNTKPEILCFHLTHLPASPLRWPGDQPRVGVGRSCSGLIPGTCAQLRWRTERPRSQGCGPQVPPATPGGGRGARPPLSTPCLRAAVKDGGGGGRPGPGDGARPTEPVRAFFLLA